MHYLEETRPQRPLMPSDVYKRAKVDQSPYNHAMQINSSLQLLRTWCYFLDQVREICEVIQSGIQPLQNLVVLIYVGEEKKKEWAQHWINRGLRGELYFELFFSSPL